MTMSMRQWLVSIISPKSLTGFDQSFCKGIYPVQISWRKTIFTRCSGLVHTITETNHSFLVFQMVFTLRWMIYHVVRLGVLDTIIIGHWTFRRPSWMLTIIPISGIAILPGICHVDFVLICQYFGGWSKWQRIISNKLISTCCIIRYKL